MFKTNTNHNIRRSSPQLNFPIFGIIFGPNLNLSVIDSHVTLLNRRIVTSRNISLGVLYESSVHHTTHTQLSLSLIIYIYIYNILYFNGPLHLGEFGEKMRLQHELLLPAKKVSPSHFNHYILWNILRFHVPYLSCIILDSLCVCLFVVFFHIIVVFGFRYYEECSGTEMTSIQS